MKICTPIQEKTQNAVIKRLKVLKGKTDIAEIWLDHIQDLDIKTLLKNKPLPVICVSKKSDLLTEAAKYGADYIDIPWAEIRNPKFEIRNFSSFEFRFSNFKIILSYHNFKKTPPLNSLLKKARDMKKAGADIVKIATMAKSMEDTFTIIQLAQILQSEKIPHILIAMGKKGILSRVLTPFLGGTIMFAPLAAKNATAPGQLTVKELKEAWGLIV